MEAVCLPRGSDHTTARAGPWEAKVHGDECQRPKVLKRRRSPITELAVLDPKPVTTYFRVVSRCKTNANTARKYALLTM